MLFVCTATAKAITTTQLLLSLALQSSSHRITVATNSDSLVSCAATRALTILQIKKQDNLWVCWLKDN